MITAEFIYDSFQKRIESLQQQIQQVNSGNYKNKNLHRLRVDIKQIRTMLMLTGLVTNHSLHNMLLAMNLKPVFKKAGQVREVLVNKKILQNYWMSKPGIQLFKQAVKRQIEKSGKNLLACAEEFKPGQLKKMEEEMRQVCLKTSAETMRTKARAFIQSKTDLIQQLLIQRQDVEQLHQIRIEFRHITNLGYLFRGTGKPVMPAKKLQQLKAFEKLLGDWHDHWDFLAWIKDFTKEIESEPYVDEWNHLIQKLSAENEEQVAVLESSLNASLALQP